MKPLIAMSMLLTVGQAVAGEQVISVQHDGARGVTCWVLEGAGISCIPDSQIGSLPQTNRGATSTEGQAARASQAASPDETRLSSPISLPQTKGLQL